MAVDADSQRPRHGAGRFRCGGFRRPQPRLRADRRPAGFRATSAAAAAGQQPGGRGALLLSCRAPSAPRRDRLVRRRLARRGLRQRQGFVCAPDRAPACQHPRPGAGALYRDKAKPGHRADPGRPSLRAAAALLAQGVAGRSARRRANTDCGTAPMWSSATPTAAISFSATSARRCRSTARNGARARSAAGLASSRTAPMANGSRPAAPLSTTRAWHAAIWCTRRSPGATANCAAGAMNG